MENPEQHPFPPYGRSDLLGRYYTKSTVGALLVSEMPGRAPRKLLDLGAGSGSLSGAALRRWSSIELLTVDVDGRAHAHLTRTFGTLCRHTHIKADALSRSLPRLLSAGGGSIDAAVCNPPFTVPRWRAHFGTILEDAGFSSTYPVLHTVDVALLFLAQNLRLIEPDATLGIILPDSLISASKYKRFRRELLNRYQVQKVIKLPRNSFRNTEALAHIVIVRKAKTTQTAITLHALGRDRPVQPMIIAADSAIDRLDFDYHASKGASPPRTSRSTTLGAIGADVRRGSLSSSERRSIGEPVLHTEHITSDRVGCWCDLSCMSGPDAGSDLVRAQPGDILIARVGRDLEHKILGVSDGTPLLTDCIYRVRVERSMRNEVLRQLAGQRGREWLASHAYGVGARQLTKSDLLNFPVYIPRRNIPRKDCQG